MACDLCERLGPEQSPHFVGVEHRGRIEITDRSFQREVTKKAPAGHPVRHHGADCARGPADAPPGDTSDGGGLDRYIAGGGCRCTAAPDASPKAWIGLLIAVGAAVRRRRRR